MCFSQAGVQVAKLKRKRSATVPLNDHVAKFRVLMHIYTDMDGTPLVMSDLTSIADSIRRHPLLRTSAPALHFLAVMGKVGPFHVALGNKWSQVFKGHAMESVCPSRWSLQSVLSGLPLRSLQYVEPDDLTKGDIETCCRFCKQPQRPPRGRTPPNGTGTCCTAVLGLSLIHI